MLFYLVISLFSESIFMVFFCILIIFQTICQAGLFTIILSTVCMEYQEKSGLFFAFQVILLVISKGLSNVISSGFESFTSLKIFYSFCIFIYASLAIYLYNELFNEEDIQEEKVPVIWSELMNVKVKLI